MRQPRKEPVSDPVVDRILALLHHQKKTQKDLTVHLRLANGTFTRWIYGGSKTYMKHLPEIASYLNVSQSDLLNGNAALNTLDNLSPAEMEILLTFRNLDQTERKTILDVVRMAKKAYKNTIVP